MVTLAFLVTALMFQFTPNTVIGSEEILNPGHVDQFDASVQLHKRYLGSLAKNKQLPSVQQRSYFVPPLVSPYGKGQVPALVEEEKRYLGALARTGDLNFSKPQHKRTAFDQLESDGPAPPSLTSLKDSRDDFASPVIMKEEMINYLRPVILEYLKKFNKIYDQRKIELFLQNLTKAVLEQNEEITMDSIQGLVLSDYFQPEENEDDTKQSSKRNLQSLVRERNISYSGTTHPEPQHQSKQHLEPPRRVVREQDDELRKRNLGSVMKNKYIARYPNYGFLRVLGKRDAIDELLDYLEDNDSQYVNSPTKRYTMYDINEPDITFEYPSQTGEQADYSDYAEQDAPISIGKRYLGALARNGWLPQGFAARSNSLSPGSFEKKHIGALARARGRWLSNTMTSPVYFSSNTQNGQGYKFRPPLFRGPRASYLKSKPQEDEPCKCKRSVDDTSGPTTFPGPNFRRLGRNTPSSTSAATRLLPSRSGPELLNKRFPMLMNVIDHYFFRKLYPDRLLRTSYNGFDPGQVADAACEADSRNCYVNRLQMQKFSQ